MQLPTGQVYPSLEEGNGVVVPRLRQVSHVLPHVVIWKIPEDVPPGVAAHAVVVMRIDASKHYHRLAIGQKKGRIGYVPLLGARQSVDIHLVPLDKVFISAVARVVSICLADREKTNRELEVEARY